MRDGNSGQFKAIKENIGQDWANMEVGQGFLQEPMVLSEQVSLAIELLISPLSSVERVRVREYIPAPKRTISTVRLQDPQKRSCSYCILTFYTGYIAIC